MLEEQAEPLTAKLIKLALDGDRVALRLCIDRLAPATSDPSISLPIPKIESAADGSSALAAVVAGVAKGAITPADGVALSQMISSTVSAIAAMDFERRLAALEKNAAEDK
jgi:hypothetical protein